MASAKQKQAPEPKVEKAPEPVVAEAPKPKRNLTRERLAQKFGEERASKMVQ